MNLASGTHGTRALWQPAHTTRAPARVHLGTPAHMYPCTRTRGPRDVAKLFFASSDSALSKIDHWRAKVYARLEGAVINPDNEPPNRTEARRRSTQMGTTRRKCPGIPNEDKLRDLDATCAALLVQHHEHCLAR